MASAQRAYSESYSGFARSAAAPSRAQRRTDGNAARSIERGRRERSLRVERTGSHGERQSSLLMTAAIMAAIVLVVIAALSFARISLMNATVTTLIEADALSSQIDTARSEGVSLEMEQSVLSNTYAINAAAKRLGMAEPYEVGVIALSPDVVAVNEDGALSLATSLKTLAQTQG